MGRELSCSWLGELVRHLSISKHQQYAMEFRRRLFVAVPREALNGMWFEWRIKAFIRIGLLDRNSAIAFSETKLWRCAVAPGDRLRRHEVRSELDAITAQFKPP